MNGDYEKYLKDKRISCKYGAKCYQQNPAHHEKYKHPPKRKLKNLQPSIKKFKAENKVIVRNNDSDSDEEDSKNQTNSDSESSVDTKNRTLRVNNDVSDSDSETSKDTSDDAEESSPEQSAQSTNNDESKGDIPKIISTNIAKKINPSLEIDEEWVKFIKEKFLVTMPEDFYQFWNFCKKIKPANTLEALREVGLYLIGPFDVLAGKFSSIKKSPDEYLIHWRYYRDPPEMQTVLRSDEPTGYHIGYFRDSPGDLPTLLVSNHSKKNGILTQMGGNIFSAVNIFLEELKKSGNPFKKMAIGTLQTALLKQADLLGIDMSKKTEEMIKREKKIVTRTFNKVGLVIPYDKKNDVGYRPLALDNKALETYLTKLQNAKTKEEKQACLSGLQPVFTFASIAADECDFGTGIELGLNIISHGVDCLNSTAEQFLVSNYKLLNRDEFAKIAEAHMKNRRKSLNLSIL
ncbi:unnamed protein product [Psylliodes chrysocephalus]|uniref:PBZ-type domain-containing protein n=1 Tax=Psylliodes chrysocephalus TaxID=3402493 RepID=A0A9P0CSF3_9CUCU|nr:unnamed protein product [Psylliodes chrysocephala]